MTNELSNERLTESRCGGRAAPCEPDVNWWYEKHARERDDYIKQHPEYEERESDPPFGEVKQ